MSQSFMRLELDRFVKNIDYTKQIKSTTKSGRSIRVRSEIFGFGDQYSIHLNYQPIERFATIFKLLNLASGLGVEPRFYVPKTYVLPIRRP